MVDVAEAPVWREIDGLQVFISPEQLNVYDDGESVNELVNWHLGRLVGPHEVDTSDFYTEELQSPDYIRAPFNWKYDPDVGDKFDGRTL